MASIIENYKKLNAEWKMMHMFDLIDNNELSIMEKIFIEVSLFIEMYDITGGMVFDEESKDFFIEYFKRINPTLNKKDNIELRQEQCDIILKIYKKHYIAWTKHNNRLRIPYLLIAYINRLDKSHRNEFIEARYGSLKSIGNFKFKETMFIKEMVDLNKFWYEVNNNIFDIDNTSVENKYEIIKTIILLQDRRGFKEGDEYE